jgi:hypothetical protein
MGAVLLLHSAAYTLELNLLATINRGGNEVCCSEPVSAFLEPSTRRVSMQDAPFAQKSYRKVPPTTARKLVS